MDFVYINSIGSIIDKPNNANADAIAIQNRQRDLMYVRFELCHANVNRNKDQFFSEELSSGFKTAIAKPINWEHTNEVIGHIYESEYIPFTPETASEVVDTNTDKIVCNGVIYKYKFPARAREIEKRYEDGNLFFSMETYFQRAKCSTCGELFPADGPYCEHLTSRRANGSTTARGLMGLTFAGAGCVGTPADDARGLAIAKHDIIDITDLMEFCGSRFTVADYINYLDLLRSLKYDK